MKPYRALLAFGMFLCASCVCSCDGAKEDPAACLADCGGVSAGLPDDAPCGADGWLYPDDCVMACRGVEKADDAWLCRSPDMPAECDAGHVGLGRGAPGECNGVSVCAKNGCAPESDCRETYGFISTALGCPLLAPECFSACEPCPEDAAAFVCGDKGVWYCNECVMECLEDGKAADASDCAQAASVKQAAFCEEGGPRWAGRNGAPRGEGCNLCECGRGFWRCTTNACPGEGSVL